MRYDLLKNENTTLVLVDVLVKPLTVEAGWVYFAPGLTSVEVVFAPGDQEKFPIQITDVLREAMTPSDTSFPNEPVEFLREL
jgi:hypothetical protein